MRPVFAGQLAELLFLRLVQQDNIWLADWESHSTFADTAQQHIRTIIVKLYGEFSILKPIRIVPRFAVVDIFLMPSGGLQNGIV